MNLIDGTYLAIEKPLLYINIFAGFVSLSIAYILLFIKKGNKRHKQLGIIYVYGMSTIFITAVPMSLLGGLNIFLFVVAIFSFYLAFAGYRQGRNRQVLEKILINFLPHLFFLQLLVYTHWLFNFI